MREALICALVIAVVGLMIHFEKYYKWKERWEFVSRTSQMPINDLRWFLESCGLKAGIQNEHRLLKDDWNSVDEILKEYQIWLMRLFFAGNLQIPKENKKRIKEFKKEDSYFYTSACDRLCIYFLAVHLLDKCASSVFLGHDMVDGVISRKYYDGGGTDTIYSISDFSVVFHKILNIATHYCKTNTAFDRFYSNFDWVEKVLNEKQTEISCYIP